MTSCVSVRGVWAGGAAGVPGEHASLSLQLWCRVLSRLGRTRSFYISSQRPLQRTSIARRIPSVSSKYISNVSRNTGSLWRRRPISHCFAPLDGQSARGTEFRASAMNIFPFTRLAPSYRELAPTSSRISVCNSAERCSYRCRPANQPCGTPTLGMRSIRSSRRASLS